MEKRNADFELVQVVFDKNSPECSFTYILRSIELTNFKQPWISPPYFSEKLYTLSNRGNVSPSLTLSISRRPFHTWSTVKILFVLLMAILVPIYHLIVHNKQAPGRRQKMWSVQYRPTRVHAWKEYKNSRVLWDKKMQKLLWSCHENNKLHDDNNTSL